ncbi:MAG: HEAT repeat domain-containing protein [Magnetococcales bacterium]|nr:HEAT repeat domain-containing protein [Magnetococcales bacterium]
MENMAVSEEPKPVLVFDSIEEVSPVEPYRLACLDANEETRLWAISRLGALEDPEAVELLGKTLTDPAEPVRLATLAELSRQTHHPLVVSLLRLGLRDSAEVVRARVVTLLGQITGGAATELLGTALKDVAEPIRLRAVEILAERDEEAVETWLQVAAKDPAPKIREMAEAALTRRPFPAAATLPPLAEEPVAPIKETAAATEVPPGKRSPSTKTRQRAGSPPSAKRTAKRTEKNRG